MKAIKKKGSKTAAARRNTRLARKRSEARAAAEAERRNSEQVQLAAKAHTESLERRVVKLENFIRDAEHNSTFNFTKAAEVLGEEVVH